MGTFSDFLQQKKITPMIMLASERLEAGGLVGRKMLTTRATKRRTEAAKSYADAGLAKPPSNRGISARHIESAMKDLPLPRKVRAKMVRAVTEVLARKKTGEPVDHKTLFGAVVAKKGEKVEKAAAA